MLFCFPTVAKADISFADKTYFTKGSLDRIYFGTDGTFQKQLEKDSGRIISGRWDYNKTDEELCLRYLVDDAKAQCLSIDEVNYNDRSNHFSKEIFATDSNARDRFVWRHWRDGNWLLKADAFQYIPWAIENRIIQNSDERDQKIADYFSGKVFDGYGFYDYAIDSDKGVQIEKATGRKIEYIWSVENLRTIAKRADNGEVIFNSFLTLGDEFLEEKPEQAYLYFRKDIVVPEGEEFKIIPINEFNKKELFAPYLTENKE
jgi:hypothetical protein